VTDDEANAAFEELMQALREKKLDWIADQVLREIAEGKSVVAMLTPEQAPKIGPFSGGRPRKTRARAAEYILVSRLSSACRDGVHSGDVRVKHSQPVEQSKWVS
jgi:hypothetical protein